MFMGWGRRKPVGRKPDPGTVDTKLRVHNSSLEGHYGARGASESILVGSANLAGPHVSTMVTYIVKLAQAACSTEVPNTAGQSIDKTWRQITLPAMLGANTSTATVTEQYAWRSAVTVVRRVIRNAITSQSKGQHIISKGHQWHGLLGGYSTGWRRLV